jgi:hypothetical protein
VRDAGIGHHQLHAGQMREDIDRGAAGEEVLHHLPGHFLREGRDAGLGRAVVAGADQHVRRRDARRQAALDQAELQGQFFEAAERAGGLGLAVDLLLQIDGQRAIQRAIAKRGSAALPFSFGECIRFILFKRNAALSRASKRETSPRHGLQENHRSVFWLPDRPRLAPSPAFAEWHRASVVPGHSGGPATESHRVPRRPDTLSRPPPNRRRLWGLVPPSAIIRP